MPARANFNSTTFSSEIGQLANATTKPGKGTMTSPATNVFFTSTGSVPQKPFYRRFSLGQQRLQIE
jgi:hypothetical protein